MKNKFFSLILGIVSASMICRAQTTPVLFSMQNLNNSPANLLIHIYPDQVQNPLWSGSNMVNTAPFDIQPHAGQVITNLLPWGYSYKIDGWSHTLHFNLSSAQGTNVVNVLALTSTNLWNPVNVYSTVIVPTNAGGITTSNGVTFLSTNYDALGTSLYYYDLLSNNVANAIPQNGNAVLSSLNLTTLTASGGTATLNGWQTLSDGTTFDPFGNAVYNLAARQFYLARIPTIPTTQISGLGNAALGNSNTMSIGGSAGFATNYGVILTPKMFGAVGDGMTDDSAAWNRAMNACTNPFTVVDGGNLGYNITANPITVTNDYCRVRNAVFFTSRQANFAIISNACNWAEYDNLFLVGTTNQGLALYGITGRTLGGNSGEENTFRKVHTVGFDVGWFINGMDRCYLDNCTSWGNRDASFEFTNSDHSICHACLAGFPFVSGPSNALNLFPSGFGAPWMNSNCIDYKIDTSPGDNIHIFEGCGGGHSKQMIYCNGGHVIMEGGEFEGYLGTNNGGCVMEFTNGCKVTVTGTGVGTTGGNPNMHLIGFYNDNSISACWLNFQGLFSPATNSYDFYGDTAGNNYFPWVTTGNFDYMTHQTFGDTQPWTNSDAGLNANNGTILSTYKSQNVWGGEIWHGVQNYEADENFGHDFNNNGTIGAGTAASMAFNGYNYQFATFGVTFLYYVNTGTVFELSVGGNGGVGCTKTKFYACANTSSSSAEQFELVPGDLSPVIPFTLGANKYWSNFSVTNINEAGATIFATNIVKPTIPNGSSAFWPSNGFIYYLTAQHPNGVLISAP